jgi:hypothetical protein
VAAPRPVPQHVELQTCIGCGARDRVRECTGECAEVRLDLVAEEAYARRAAGAAAPPAALAAPAAAVPA